MAGCRRHEERRAPLAQGARLSACHLPRVPLASLAQSRLLPLPLRFRLQKPRLRSLGGPAAFPARGRRLRLRFAITPSPPLRGRPAQSRRLRLASLACNRRALAGRVAAALNMPSPAGLDGERTPSQAQDAPAQAEYVMLPLLRRALSRLTLRFAALCMQKQRQGAPATAIRGGRLPPHPTRRLAAGRPGVA